LKNRVESDNAGAGERTTNDEREVRQRKQEIEAISHEKWLAMSVFG